MDRFRNHYNVFLEAQELIRIGCEVFCRDIYMGLVYSELLIIARMRLNVTGAYVEHRQIN